MSDKIKAFIGRFKYWIGAGVVLVILVFIADLACSLSEEREKNIYLANKLADETQLRTVVQNSLGTLQERYSRQGADFELALGHNILLKQRIKEKDGKMLSLVERIEKTKLENISVQGREMSDSSIAFDTLDQHFTFSSRLFLRPRPMLNILGMLFIDTSAVGHYEAVDGIITGVITHSNPYVLDYSSTFQIRTDDIVRDAPRWWAMPIAGYGGRIGGGGIFGLREFGLGGYFTPRNRPIWLGAYQIRF